MKVKVINLPRIVDLRGNLTYIQFPEHIPFEIKRVYWTYHVPGGDIRDGHAYHTQEEIIIALSGSFDVTVVDKSGTRSIVTLNRSYNGLYIPPNTWRHIENFSTNSLSLHLSSSHFNEDDYLRDFQIFLQQ